MRLGHWLRLIGSNGFRIHPTRWPMALLITLATPINSLAYLLQQAIYGRKIKQTEIRQPPVFILGHWRSGTTYLHELLVLDERFAYPTTFQCFGPHHILLTEGFFTRYCGFLVPKQRPMDNVATGWLRPQEDEFALLAMGAATPYRRLAFPNRPPPDTSLLDMEDVDAAQLERWKSALNRFLRLLTLRDGRRLVLKSPPHTGRIATLAEMFPGARFVHIVRDPYAIFPSTRRLWQALDSLQGLQKPQHRDLDEYILASFERMYRAFERQRATIPAEQICDVKYEELVRDPVGQLESIYQQLDLGDFEAVRPQIEAHAQQQKSYKTNLHSLEPGEKTAIRQRWSGYFERYGYQ